MSKKIHNPKSTAPAVYIQSWLIQVPHSDLSFGAKLLYGRLAQWSNTTGDVYRSSRQLSKELGIGERTVERFIQELKEVELIGTFQPRAGGLNHFKFYDHPWMHKDLAKELSYEIDPPPHLAVPPASPGGTPPPHLAGINIKEIKQTKDNIYISENDSKTSEPQKIKENPYVDSTYDTAYKTSERTDHFHEPDPNEPFERFWDAYPSKQNKPMCKQLWLQADLDGKIEDILIKLKEQVAKDSRWLDGIPPNPATYIKQEAWNNDIRLAPNNNRGGKSSANKPQYTTNGKPSTFDNTSTDWIKDLGVWKCLKK